MPMHNAIPVFHADMTAWRDALHCHPELALQEHRTSAVIQEKLKSDGADETITSLASAGVIGVIHGGAPGGVIGLRADIDALPILKDTGLPYTFETLRVMHACEHDGHTKMPLAAARHLCETRNFASTVYVIFQPAEELHGGVDIIIRDGRNPDHVLDNDLLPIGASYGAALAEQFLPRSAS